MQESLTSKYNKLLSFRHEEVILEGVSSSKICVVRLQSDLHLLLQALAFEYTER